jgi:hypothetical protein
MTATPTAASRSLPELGTVLGRITEPLATQLGLAPTLTTVHALTGEHDASPTVHPFEHAGARYLVSPYRDTRWVRHLRSAAWAELRLHWHTELVLAWEVGGAERDRVVAAYRAALEEPARQHFDRLPDAAGHPVFRIVAGAARR